MENLIKLHKAQLASDRMSCHSATPIRYGSSSTPRVLADARRTRRDPRTSPLASAEFATIRERLIKIGARVIEHIARIRIQLPTVAGGWTVPTMRSASCRQAHEPRGQGPQRTARTGRSIPNALHRE